MSKLFSLKAQGPVFGAPVPTLKLEIEANIHNPFLMGRDRRILRACLPARLVKTVSTGFSRKLCLSK